MATKAEWKARALTAEGDLAISGASLDKALSDLAISEQARALLTAAVAANEAEITGLNTEIAALQDKLRACEAKLPPPADNWRTVRTVKPADWNERLIEGFRGATITTEGDNLRFKVSTSGPSGSRCEVQAYFGEEGMTCAYEWKFLIPAYVNLKALRSVYSLIHQGHGNEKAGFTSGTKINNADDRIGVSVKGGEELSTAGSHRYESEREFFFGQIKRDTWHTIRHEVYWHRSAGWYRARLDQGAWGGIEDVPTWPIGNADGVSTENIMVRYGFYPQWGEVPNTGLEMVCGPMTFQEKV